MAQLEVVKVLNGDVRPMAHEWPMPLMNVVGLSSQPQASDLRNLRIEPKIVTVKLAGKRNLCLKVQNP